MPGIDFICANCGCGSTSHTVEWAPASAPAEQTFAVGSHARTKTSSIRMASDGRRAWRRCLSENCSKAPGGGCRGRYPMLDPRSR